MTWFWQWYRVFRWTINPVWISNFQNSWFVITNESTFLEQDQPKKLTWVSIWYELPAWCNIKVYKSVNWTDFVQMWVTIWSQPEHYSSNRFRYLTLDNWIWGNFHKVKFKIELNWIDSASPTVFNFKAIYEDVK